MHTHVADGQDMSKRPSHDYNVCASSGVCINIYINIHIKAQVMVQKSRIAYR